VMRLEPDCRAAWQQRVRQQQIQVANHAGKVTGGRGRVKSNFSLTPQS
jgi:hypothetical protein